MLAKPKQPRIPLPKDWQGCVKSAVLHAIALAFCHPGDVMRRVKIVCIQKRSAKLPGEEFADGALAGTGNSNQHDDHFSWPVLRTGMSR